MAAVVASGGIALVGCIVLLQISPYLCGWPEGTYGIPAHQGGCPKDPASQWRLGSRLHVTEFGSHLSKINHFHNVNEWPSSWIIQTFCMKTLYTSDNKYHFMPGKYCLFKKYKCPNKFQEGWIYWDDAGPLLGPTIQNASGVLPDGNYDRNTKIRYCCRNDGLTHEALVLPSSEPFFLIKLGDECQEVENMNVFEEWMYWSGETFINQDSEGGLYPKMEQSKYPFIFRKLFYCYYVPKPSVAISNGSWLQTFLLVLYVIGAFFGVIFLTAVLLASVQRALIYCQQCKQQQLQHQPAVACGRKSCEYTLAVTSLAACKEGHHLNGKISTHTDQEMSVLAKRVDPLIATVHDDCDSMESSCFPDAESEAPPSYDEVLREGCQGNVKPPNHIIIS